MSHPSPTAAAALPAAYSAEERGRAAILRAASYASTLLLLLHFRPIFICAGWPICIGAFGWEPAAAPPGGRRRLLQMRMMRIMMHGSSSAQRGCHLPWY